jgi:glycosyltransferase involved in cell wall biosynthesis
VTIAMVTRRVHPAHGPGGLERHVFELVTHLTHAGLDVELFAEAPSDPARRELADRTLPASVRVHWIPGGWLPIGRRKGTVVLDRITNYPWWSHRVARLVIERHGPSGRSAWAVIHAHGLAGLGLARAVRHGRLTCPLVVTTQGLEEFQSTALLKRWGYAPFRTGMRAVAAASNAVVTTDAALVPVVERHLGVPASSQVVIPNAVDPAGCRQQGSRARGLEILQALGLSNATPVFLSVGRLEANKGFAGLVSALATAACRLPSSWAWVLAGDGPERVAIERAVSRHGLQDHARLAGRLTDGDVHSLYAAADWFVHPTLYEGSSLVTLEAMSHGLPVIASRAGGLPDKVDEGVTGFLVPPGDTEALAARIAEAHTIDARALGRAGLALCESRFSWPAVVPRYLALYERLASSRCGPA